MISGSQEHFALEYPCHSPSMQRWFMMNVIPFKGEKGGVVIAHTDISPRKKAEIKLRRAELDYRTVADYTYDWEYSGKALMEVSTTFHPHASVSPDIGLRNFLTIQNYWIRLFCRKIEVSG